MWLTLEQIKSSLAKGLRVQQSVKHPGCMWYPMWKGIHINQDRYDYRIDPRDDKTKWFNGITKPVYVGEYEVERSPRFNDMYPLHTFLYWNGWRWEYTKHACGDTLPMPRYFASVTFNCRWRGLNHPT